MLDILILGVFPGLVVLAATMDVFTMTIPNKLCLALIAAFFLAVPFSDMSLVDVGMHSLAGLLALGVTFVLFAAGVFGGGDAKLTAALVLWLGPHLTMDFVLFSAIFGGALGLLVITLRVLPTYMIAFDSGWAMRLLSRDVGMPYGVALSGAAMVVFSQSPWFIAAIAP